MRALDVIATQRINDLPANLQDVPSAIIDDLITWISAGPCHIRTCCQGMYEDFDFFEMAWPKSRFGRLSEIDLSIYSMLVFRHKLLPFPLPNAVEQYALFNMLKFDNEIYDVGQLVTTQLLHILGLDDNTNLTPGYVCSTMNGHIMLRVGYPWYPNKIILTPGDIITSPVAIDVTNEGKGGEQK